MEGFTKNAKMQCFKEGGAVKYKSRHSETKEMEKDVAQDKSVVKKAFKMHDTQSHEGNKTDLSKLCKGGRAKKAGGSVRKFEKASGQYGAKKTSADNKNIKQAKQFKVKKLADGGMSGMGDISDAERGGMDEGIKDAVKWSVKRLTGQDARFPKGQGAISDMERRAMAKSALGDMEKQRQMDRIKRAQKYLGPEQQAEFAGQEREFLGRKKGGKVKKYASGGDVVSQEAEDIIQGKRPVQAKPGEMTPAERRASIAKAFGAKPSPAPAPKAKSSLSKDAEELQRLLGDDVVVSPAERRKRGGSIKRK